MKRVLILTSMLIATSPASAASKFEMMCSYAPSQSEIVNNVSIAAGGAAATSAAITQATGLTAVAHSSGAYIFTGSSGYVAGTLGGAITAPVIVGVGLIVGGTAVTVEMICVPKNHPALEQKLSDASREFMARSKAYWKSTESSLRSTRKEVTPIIVKAGDTVLIKTKDAFEYSYRMFELGKYSLDNAVAH